MNTKSFIRVVGGTLLILLIPLIAMQFTSEVVWTVSDFVIMGALLFGFGMTYEFLASKGGSLAYRGGVAGAVGTTLLLIWVNLAVGIIGSEDNPANALYLGVLVVEVLGITLSRLQPQGMARAMFASAGAVLLVPIMAYLIWQPGMSEGVVQVFGINVFFATLFATAGLLFIQAHRPAVNASVSKSV